MVVDPSLSRGGTVRNRKRKQVVRNRVTTTDCSKAKHWKENVLHETFVIVCQPPGRVGLKHALLKSM